METPPGVAPKVCFYGLNQEAVYGRSACAVGNINPTESGEVSGTNEVALAEATSNKFFC